MTTIRILVELGELKDGSQVTKRNGEKIYTVKRKLTVYDRTDACPVGDPGDQHRV